MISEISQGLDFHAESHNLHAFYYLICMSLTTSHNIPRTVFLELQVFHFFFFSILCFLCFCNVAKGII